jgi:hypothetical protein
MTFKFDPSKLSKWRTNPERILAPLILGQDAINKMLENGEVDGVILSAERGHEASLSKIISQMPLVRIVAVSDSSYIDLSLNNCANIIEEISVISPSKINLELFPGLSRLSVGWSPECIVGSQSSSLTCLALRQYKSKGRDLSDLPILHHLNDFHLIQSNIHNIAGIEKYAELVNLRLSHNAFLKEIDGPEMRKVKYLNIQRSRSLNNHYKVVRFPNTVILGIHECGFMRSLSFVGSMRQLRSFRFIGTGVDDGDLSPLLRLDDVQFTQKRNFSHKNDDFRKADPELQRLMWAVT